MCLSLGLLSGQCDGLGGAGELALVPTCPLPIWHSRVREDVLKQGWFGGGSGTDAHSDD